MSEIWWDSLHCVTEALWWTDTSSLGKIGRESEEGVLLSLWRSSSDTWSSSVDRMAVWLITCRTGWEGSPVRVTSRWEFVTDHPFRVSKEAFFKQFEEVSVSQTLVLMGIFSLPDILWKCNKVECMQSRRFVEWAGDDFLIQDEPAHSWICCSLASKELVLDMVINDIFGCSYPEIVEFKVLGEVRLESSRVDFMSVDFHLFGKLIGRMPWKVDVEVKGGKVTDLQVQPHPSARTGKEVDVSRDWFG